MSEQAWIRNQALSLGQGQRRIKCPYCSATRKNKRDTSLSISIDTKQATYNCHHCGETGHVFLDGKATVTPIHEAKPLKIVAGELSEVAQKFLSHRGVSIATARGLGLFSAMRYSRKAQEECEAIAFPYRNGDGTYAVKYRIIEPKDFSWDGSPVSMWGMERVEVEGFDGEEPLPLIICEGEFDALTLNDCGIMNAVSVPNGAPNKAGDGKVDPKHDKGFSFLWEGRDVIGAAGKIIICADADGPGEALAEEIARRVGRVNCWTVTYPEDCKDINDVLMRHGVDAVHECIATIRPWPVAGLFDANHYRDSVEELYLNGPGKGHSTGYPDVDDIYSIAGGFVSIVTGIPGSGKSEFIDQVMFNLADTLDWKFAVCSFENPPSFHIPKLAEKYTMKPFFEGLNTRMSHDEKGNALEWINDHFAFMDHSDGEPATIESILGRAEAAVLRMGVRGLVIDPFNYIELHDGEATETKVISDMLTKIRLFAISHDVHVWFIAHPRILRSSDGGGIPIPKGYDISGSAAWFSKADFGVTITRPWMHSPIVADDFGNKSHSMTQDSKVEVHVWKCRFKWLGQVGVAKLDYNPANGCYAPTIDWGGVNV